MTEQTFISHYIEKITDEIKQFPSDFVNLQSSKKMLLPAETLLLGNELFGSYEIIKADGSPAAQAENLHKAKYIVYASKNRTGEILIPQNESLIKQSVEEYETYLDSLLHRIEKEFKNEFPESQNIHEVVAKIFNKLNLIRI